MHFVHFIHFLLTVLLKFVLPFKTLLTHKVKKLQTRRKKYYGSIQAADKVQFIFNKSTFRDHLLSGILQK